jgi:hypothetical protein
MKVKSFITALVLFPLLLSAQIDLTNRNSISLYGGTMLNNSSSTVVGISGVSTEINAIGTLEYAHNFSNEWALGLSSGLFSIATSTSITGVSNVSIYPTFFELKYYPEAFTLGNSVRGYAGIGIGAYTATANKVGIGLTSIVSNINETLFGVRPHLGVDIFILNWLTIGPNLSYHFMGDFKEVVGERKNYSGPAIAIKFGLVF